MREKINISPAKVAIHLLSNNNFDRFAFLSGDSLGNTFESSTISGCNPAAIPAINGPAETGPQL